MDPQQKSDQFFSHFGRLFATQRAKNVSGLESLAEATPVADFSSSAIDERMEKTNDELARIVEQYLSEDPHAAAIAEKIRKEGGETLRRFGQHDESLASDHDAGDLLEAIVLTDGTRPTFLIKNGKVDRQSSVLGTWGGLLDSNAAQLKDAIACVGRIDHPGVSGGYIGTGFLISDNLIVTNRHVLQAIAKWNGHSWNVANGVAIDFGHEWDGKQTLNRRAIKAVLFANDKEIDPSRIDHTKLDMAVLSLEPTRASVKYFQLAMTETWKSSGANVCTIGYPGPPPSISIPPTLIEQLFQSHYGYKRLAPGEVKTPQVSAPKWTVAHDATTLGGNSGSVIISVGENGFAAGLHYGGKWSEPRENWGHILADVLDTTDLASRESLREVLAANNVDVPIGNSHPSVSPKPDPVDKQRPAPNDSPIKVTGDPKPVGKPTTSRLTRAHSVTLQQMRFLGVLPGSTRTESMELEAAGDGETSPRELANRKGYDPNFLSDWHVPLPQPSGDMRTLRRGGTGTELKYQHFSVIMSASRRMPIITAVNIDGSQSRRLPRIDKWSYDGRLNQSDQIGNELYNSNELDRGHMVRREDPVWGDANTAKRANVDTFHYTNSCPQMAGVNQRTWLGLEEYVLQHTREDEMRISVFTGPYFSDDDMTYRGALIPKAFWKVIAFQLDDGRNSATAYKVSQSRELEDLEFVFAAYKTFQISIQQVADDTGIDFSELIPFDGFSTHEFTHGGRLSERIESLSQIRV